MSLSFVKSLSLDCDFFVGGVDVILYFFFINGWVVMCVVRGCMYVLYVCVVVVGVVRFFIFIILKKKNVI